MSRRKYEILADAGIDMHKIASYTDYAIKQAIVGGLLRDSGWVWDNLHDAMTAVDADRMGNMVEALVSVHSTSRHAAPLAASRFSYYVGEALQNAAEKEAERDLQFWIEDALSYLKGDAA